MASKGSEKLYSPDAEEAEHTPVRAKRGPKPKATSSLPRHEPIPLDPERPHAATADAALTGTDDGALRKDIERIRKMRRPFGAMTQKLALPERRGYKRHWFIDEPGRIDGAQANGWTHVKDKEDKPVRRVAGRARDGGALYTYAMEIPRIFWEEDQQAKFAEASARVAEIKKHPFRAKPGQAQQSDAGKFYSAKEDDVLKVQEPSV